MNSEATPAVQARRVLTVGHSNGSLAEFLDLLRTHGVERVVDVRSAPYSRYVPHFNRESLEAELDQVDIAHGYGGEYLGGRCFADFAKPTQAPVARCSQTPDEDEFAF
jgi:uncharacterized protein (DUF488 family)